MTKKRDYSEITPAISKLAELCNNEGYITPELYEKYKVNRGLRDLNGNGVLTGLTEISEIEAKTFIDGSEKPCRGRLFYRGYDVKELVKGFIEDDRFGFEEITYLLLFGKLPAEGELSAFKEMLPITDRFRIRL